ncbi:MAG: IS91 family transposase, partial [bacterium]|nr:IS91 family transposase [bacterium]
MIRYYGYYSSKSRGLRKNRGGDKHTALRLEAADLSSREYRRRWAGLIKKIFEINPLVCPDCGGHMKI